MTFLAPFCDPSELPNDAEETQEAASALGRSLLSRLAQRPPEHLSRLPLPIVRGVSVQT